MKLKKLLTLSAVTISTALIPLTSIVSCGKPAPAPEPEPEPEPTIVPEYEIALNSEREYLIPINDYANQIELSFTLSRKDAELTDDTNVTLQMITSESSTLSATQTMTREGADITVIVSLDNEENINSGRIDFDLEFSIATKGVAEVSKITLGGFAIVVYSQVTTILPKEFLNIKDAVFYGLDFNLTWNKVLELLPDINTVSIPENVLEVTQNSLSGMPEQIKTVTFDQGDTNDEIPLWIDPYGLGNMPYVTKLVLPERLEYVDEYGFSGNTAMETLDISSWSQERFNGLNPFCGGDIFSGWPTKGSLSYAKNCGLGAYCFLKVNSFSGTSKGLPTEWFDMSSGMKDIVKDGFCVTEITDETISGKHEYVIYGLDSNIVSEGVLTIPEWATGLAPQALSVVNKEGGEYLRDMSKLDMSQNTNITKVSYGCFFNNEKLEEVKLNAAITCIDSSGFRGNSKLSSINWSELTNLQWIGSCAFWDDVKGSPIKNLDLSSTKVSYIGPSAFKYLCAEHKDPIETIKLPSTLKKIGANAFNTAVFASNTEIDIPSSVTYIGLCAFEYTANIININFVGESQLGYVGEGAFAEMSDLIKINFPKTVYYIGLGVLSNSNIQEITIDSNNERYGVANNALFRKDNDGHLIELLAVVKYLNSDGFNDDKFKYVTSIADYTFERTKISDGSSDNLDFSKWTSLTNIGLGSFRHFNIKGEQGKYTFTITLPQSIKTIGAEAFYNNMRLSHLIWTNPYQMNLSSIGDNAFLDCPSLTSFEVPNGIKSLKSDILYVVSGSHVVSSITLPNTLESITGSDKLPSTITTIDLSHIVDMPTQSWTTNKWFEYLNDGGVVYVDKKENIEFWKAFLKNLGHKYVNSWTFTVHQE